MINPNGFLMVEPSGPASPQPIIDDLTKRATAIWRRKVWTDPDVRYRGVHRCICGAISSNGRHSLFDRSGPETSSLLVHYLAYHRFQIPKTEVDKVFQIEVDGEVPTDEELRHPPRR